jgi:DNA polymerase III subunit delta
MIIFLHGADTHRSRRKLDEITANFREREDKAGFNTAVFEGAKSDIGDIQQALFVPAFLGNKRMVVIVGLLAMKRDSQKPFEELIGKLPASPTAVFYETAEAKVLEKSPLFPLLSESKFHWEFGAMNVSQMTGWILAEAQEKKADIEPAAADALAEAVNGDSGRAGNELAKLIAYAGGKRKIKEEDVAALVTGNTQEDMFGFLDAVANKMPEKAAAMLERQIDAGIEPMQMLAMLARTVRLLIQARDMLDRGLPQNEAVKELGIHPFAARKTLAQARNFSMDVLKSLHASLLESDRKVKTGQAPSPRLVLDLLVARTVRA